MGITRLNQDLPKELEHFQQRDVIWLWGFLLDQGAPLDGNLFFDRQARARHIRQYIELKRARDSIIDTILSAHRSLLVPNKDIKWIREGGERVARWLFGYLVQNYPESGGESYPPIVDPYDRVIARLDLWPDRIVLKRDVLSEARAQWSEIRRQDRQLAWLDKTDEEQGRWAWEYVNQEGIAIHPGAPPLSAQDFHLATLSSFDSWQVAHPAQREQFIQKMRGSWNRRQYRARNADKKQCNFLLRVEVRDRLEVLAQRYGMKINETVEFLIDQEYEQLRSKDSQLV